MTLVARLQDENSIVAYGLHIHLVNSWFDESFLVLNVSETKEHVFDSRKEKQPFKPVTTDQRSVNVVVQF